MRHGPHPARGRAFGGMRTIKCHTQAWRDKKHRFSLYVLDPAAKDRFVDDYTCWTYLRSHRAIGSLTRQANRLLEQHPSYKFEVWDGGRDLFVISSTGIRPIEDRTRARPVNVANVFHVRTWD